MRGRLTEEISRVVRARAANPAWIAGMMRHGFRGAAEITATLEHMAAFAHLAGAVPPHLFDLYYDATLGRRRRPRLHGPRKSGGAGGDGDVFHAPA